jgi:hypothetical protein
VGQGVDALDPGAVGVPAVAADHGQEPDRDFTDNSDVQFT